MRGDIIRAAAQSEPGEIRGEDARTYTYDFNELRSGAEGLTGARVNFLTDGDRARDIYVLSAPGLIARSLTSVGEDMPMRALKAKSLWAYFVDCIFRKYAVFSGRARRREFWGFWLFGSLFAGAAMAIDLTAFSEIDLARSPLTWEIAMPSTGALAVLLLLPSFSVAVRRLHDQKITGWVFLIFFAIPIGPLIILFLMLFDGFKAPNRHGASPKYGVSEKVAETFR